MIESRGGAGTSWILFLLALPGAAWSVWVALIASAPFFGETATAQDHATSAAAMLSGASLWLVTAACSVLVSRGVAVPVLSGIAAAVFAALSLGVGPRAPLSSADEAGWGAAWTLPTGWVVICWLLGVAGTRVYRAVVAHSGSSMRP
ncbi:hypothetical protein [Actinoplanes ianthinogenes]|uniref:hypothetical protein n=1 Tax=Actinoplanes ianthinogenes TaxID=122358 RepID=UPI001670C9C1|nr:hypothetical protein [Actinoplanes ianthinogenes]